jgi:hypothetical protein
MDFGVRTIKSPRRFFLVEVSQINRATVLTAGDIAQAVTAMFIRLFGSEGMAALNLEVAGYSADRFICSVPSNLGVALRSALTLPIVPLPSAPEIAGFRVLSEASFMQALLHDSRLDFPPLM